MSSSTKSIILGVALALLGSNVIADEKEKFLNGTFGGSFKLGTDYVFRGESETADGDIPMVQGSITWTHEDNWYAGFFGSTNKFDTAPDIYAVMGPYVGKSGSIGDTGLDYNVFVFSYMYPGASRYNYTELWMYLSKKFGPVTIKGEITPTLNDWFGVDGWDGINYAAHASGDLPGGFNLSGTLGYQDLDGEGAEGWTHWNLGVSKEFYGMDVDLRYHDTDVGSDHEVYGDYTYMFDERVVLSVSMSF